jgi:transcriptional/translational regulatory protein YebC/TACO1
MAGEEQILERWRTLTPEKQQQVLKFVDSLQSESDVMDLSESADFVGWAS